MKLNFFARQQGRIAARNVLHESGVPLLQAITYVRTLEDDDLAFCVEQAAKQTGVPVPTVLLAPEDGNVEAIGDGKIIDSVVAWCKTDEGKAFRAALIKIVLALFAGLA